MFANLEINLKITTLKSFLNPFFDKNGLIADRKPS